VAGDDDGDGDGGRLLKRRDLEGDICGKFIALAGGGLG
jgi:hypothetical protein